MYIWLPIYFDSEKVYFLLVKSVKMELSLVANFDELRRCQDILTDGTAEIGKCKPIFSHICQMCTAFVRHFYQFNSKFAFLSQNFVVFFKWWKRADNNGKQQQPKRNDCNENLTDVRKSDRILKQNCFMHAVC